MTAVYQAYRRARGVGGQIKRGLAGTLTMAPRVAHVTWQRVLNHSDYKRWSDPRNLETWWDARTEKLAHLIPPASRVLEFGAGRQQLKRYLDATSTYLPSDLTDRGPGTIVCDLNVRPLPDFRELHVDVAVFGGVLEYIKDLPSLITWLAQQTTMVVTSYDGVKSERMTQRRLLELFRRRHFGYLNNYSIAQVKSLFSSAGFRCVTADVWDSQQILAFVSDRSWSPTGTVGTDAP